jgi:phosphoribosylformylglycinamidine synthase
LARAAEALGTPVTGGNVSFYNEFDGRAILPTPTIGMVGLIEDIDWRMTHDFKAEGHLVVLVGDSREELGSSEVHHLLTGRDEGPVPSLDLGVARRMCDFLVEAAQARIPVSAHDCAEGGLAAALFESAEPNRLGLDLEARGEISTAAFLFGESTSRVVASLDDGDLPALSALAGELGLPLAGLGRGGPPGGRIRVAYNGELVEGPLEELAAAWSSALPREAAL